jgi:hypothetical protein
MRIASEGAFQIRGKSHLAATNTDVARDTSVLNPSKHTIENKSSNSLNVNKTL